MTAPREPERYAESVNNHENPCRQWLDTRGP